MNLSESEEFEKRRKIYDDSEEVKLKSTKNLKTYTKKSTSKKNMMKIKEELQEETEFILPD